MPPVRAANGAENWLQPNADAVNSAWVPTGHGPAHDVQRGWTYDDDYYHDGVAVRGGTVYVAGNGLTALDERTGAEQWRLEPQPGEREREREGDTPDVGAPAVDGEVVYAPVGFGAYDAHRIPREDFLGVDAATGEIVFRFDPSGSRDFSAPTLADRTAYTRCTWEQDDRDQTLFALHPDGSVRWEAAVHDGAAPVAVGDLIVVTGDTGVVALDTQTGETVWQALSERSLTHGVPPIVAHERVYVVTRTASEATVVALDAETGDRQWTFTVSGDGPQVSVRAVDEQRVFLQDPSRDVDVITLGRDGKERWQTTIDDNVDGYIPTEGLARVGSVLYAGATALDPATGNVRWTRRMDDYMAYGLRLDAVANGRAYLRGSAVVTLTGESSTPSGTSTPTAAPDTTPTQEEPPPASPTATSRTADPSPTPTRTDAQSTGGRQSTASTKANSGHQSPTREPDSPTATNQTTTPGSIETTSGTGPAFGPVVGVLGVCGGVAAFVRGCRGGGSTDPEDTRLGNGDGNGRE